MQHIAIIGNGIAGITAARHIRKRIDAKISVISGETEHFFSRTALMYIYMGHMQYKHTKPYEDWFWLKNKIDLVKDWVTSIDFNSNKINLQNQDSIAYDQLIIATGSKSNKFGWKGQELNGVQGLYSYQDLEIMEKNTLGIKHAVVVGGGLIGIEMTEMLHSRGIQITYLVREKNFWDIVLTKNEAKLIGRHILEYGINLRLETELKEILDDGNGNVKGVTTNSGDTIDCQFVGLTVGVSPNIDLVRSTELDTDKGILVNEYLETNIPGVYAAGDCVQLRKPNKGRNPTEAVWYTGRMMGEVIAKTIAGEKTKYDQGIWFNSAKFFDIEYQTYGQVKPNTENDTSHFYWECDDHKKCLTIAYQKQSKTVLGVNTFGIRMRHEVWNQWIKEEITLDKVIDNLHIANFDPEFFKQYDNEIKKIYNGQFQDNQVKLRKPTIVEKIFG